MHFRARSYDPRLGRFIQLEPLINIRARQHYTYVSNVPTAKVDPSGLQEEVAPVPPAGRLGGSKELTAQQRKTVNADLLQAITLSRNAITVLDRIVAVFNKKGNPAFDPSSSEETKAVVEFFGSFTTVEEVDMVRDRFAKAKAVLSNEYQTQYRFEHKASRPNLVEYKRIYYNPDLSSRASTPGGGAKPGSSPMPWWYIELGDEYFKSLSGAGTRTRESILIHEATHAAWGSNDVSKDAKMTPAQRLQAARDLAAQNPAAARDEASNYQFFAESIRDNQKIKK